MLQLVVITSKQNNKYMFLYGCYTILYCVEKLSQQMFSAFYHKNLIYDWKFDAAAMLVL